MRRVLFGAVVAVIAVSVAGCGSDSSKSSDASQSAAPATTTAASATTTPAAPTPTTTGAPLVMPAGCLAAPDQLLATINASFNDSAEQLIDAWAVQGLKDVTYIGGNIFAGEKRVSSGDVWAAKGGAIYSLSGDARKRTSLPDGRKILDISAGDDDGAKVAECVSVAVRIRNTGPR
jgi:hypothetical protein